MTGLRQSQPVRLERGVAAGTASAPAGLPEQGSGVVEGGDDRDARRRHRFRAVELADQVAAVGGQHELLDRSAGLGMQRIARGAEPPRADRKSTRLNSSHVAISYAVFCLKKKNNN